MDTRATKKREPILPPPGAILSVADEQKMIDKLEDAAEFCEWCMCHGVHETQVRAERLLERLKR